MVNHPLFTTLGYCFDQQLLDLALTHRSYAYENGIIATNERLEFLGDAVLQLVSSSELFHRYEREAESGLSAMRANIVNTVALANIARELQLGSFLKIGHGEEKQGGRDKDSLLADALEAVFGAVYLAGGYEVAARVITMLLQQSLDNASSQGHRMDWKTPLQELLAARKMSPAKYEVEISGPKHAPIFDAAVYIDRQLFGTGTGGNRRAAEQQAAKAAVTVLNAAPHA